MEHDTKRFVLEMGLKALQVARIQYEELKIKLLELHKDLKPEQVESQNHWFLEIPKEQEDVDLKVVLKYLFKYHVILRHMSEENPLSEDFTMTLKETNEKVLQLMECFKQALLLLTDNSDYDTIDEGEAVLPEDLKVESDISARQRRDFLVVRNYNVLLELSEKVIKDLI